MRAAVELDRCLSGVPRVPWDRAPKPLASWGRLRHSRLERQFHRSNDDILRRHLVAVSPSGMPGRRPLGIDCEASPAYSNLSSSLFMREEAS
jgi:hypothetical protein